MYCPCSEALDESETERKLVGFVGCYQCSEGCQRYRVTNAYNFKDSVTYGISIENKYITEQVVLVLDLLDLEQEVCMVENHLLIQWQELIRVF